MVRSAEQAKQRFLTRADVAELLGVSPNTVARWARNGQIPCHVTIGGHRRFERAVVEELLAEMRGKAASGPKSDR
jgi:excisionase family DNA binding protein